MILGGYGQLGRLCAQELAGRSRAPIVVAGRSLQRAESLALSLGERARGVYANALGPRTLARAVEGAGLLVACCGGDQITALQVALELRVPFIGVSPLRIEARSRALVAEQAWRSQVPVVLSAGAVPGIPGIAAELLVRQLPSIRQLRIASTGAWVETETARRDAQLASVQQGEDSGTGALRRRIPELWRFAEPIGMRPVVPSSSADLDGFRESHCVETLSYLEPPRGVIGRSLGRLVSRQAEPGFALAAIASSDPEPGAKAIISLEFFAPNALTPAAALIGALGVEILEGRAPAGLSTPRELLRPAVALLELEKRGVRVSQASS